MMSNNSATVKCNAYHHGNLRDALIIAAAELIDENGSLDFAMIDAARRAGVSSAAPYRHFDDKDALLQAVCQVAFMRLTEINETAGAAYALGTSERIINLGKSYLHFVTSHPNYYELMWGRFGIKTMESDPNALRTSGFYLLVEAIQSWCEATGAVGHDPVDLGTKLWAMAHGLAGLTLNHHIEKLTPGVDVYALLESSTHTFLGGLENMSERQASSGGKA